MVPGPSKGCFSMDQHYVQRKTVVVTARSLLPWHGTSILKIEPVRLGLEQARDQNTVTKAIKIM